MKNKTAAAELKDWVKEKVPAAGTNEALRTMQSVLGNIMYEIHKNTIVEEKAQLKDAFNKGVVYGMLLSTNKHDNEDLQGGFEKYFKDRYEDDQA